MPVTPQGSFRFGDDFELDVRTYELRSKGIPLKLNPIPMELLILLLECRGALVTREQIVERVWGKGVFLDTDNSINAAVSKIRQVLRDDPDHPRFVLTIPGKGYRFIAPVVEVSQVQPAPAAAKPEPAGESLIGKKVSHYRILELLGGGGMGIVYRAEDLKLGRRVAIKFLPAEMVNDPKAFQRFEREARAASALDHRNICAIHQLGEYEGQPFIVMQLLEGQTLREWIETTPSRKKPQHLQQLLDLAIQIADGLDAAHQKGVIHRDIKPANIFITTRGEAKILDFGVAKFVEEYEGGMEPLGPSQEAGSLPNPTLTRTGSSMGTPSYLSPEQIRGEKLDGRSDLFSLGLVLYEMATGRRAFVGNTAPVIREAVLTQQIVPVHRLNSGLPPELEGIIDKALEKDRNLRYQHASEMRTDLQRLKRDSESGRGVVATSSTAAVSDAPFRAGKLWKIAVPVLLVALLAARVLYYRLHQSKPLTDKDTVVLADFSNTTGESVFDDALKQGLSAQLEQSPFLNVLSDDRIAQTLALMAQAKDTRLSHQLATEVCQRTGSAAIIKGSIATLGRQYVLGLKAVNCRSGDLVAEEQGTANGKEQVLKALGEAATKLRGAEV